MPTDGKSLTDRQLAAVGLVCVGLADQEIADRLGVHRVTVARWRLYHPEFRAELARRRAEIWGLIADRIRQLTLKATEAAAAALDELPPVKRGELAVAILKAAAVPAAPPPEPLTAGEVIEAEVAMERDRERRAAEAEFAELGDGLDPPEVTRQRVAERLRRLADGDAD